MKLGFSISSIAEITYFLFSFSIFIIPVSYYINVFPFFFFFK